MMIKSLSLSAVFQSRVAVRLSSLWARKSLISASSMGDFLLLMSSTFSGTTSRRVTSLCWASNVARLRPT